MRLICGLPQNKKRKHLIRERLFEPFYVTARSFQPHKPWPYQEALPIRLVRTDCSYQALIPNPTPTEQATPHSGNRCPFILQVYQKEFEVRTALLPVAVECARQAYVHASKCFWSIPSTATLTMRSCGMGKDLPPRSSGQWRLSKQWRGYSGFQACS